MNRFSLYFVKTILTALVVTACLLISEVEAASKLRIGRFSTLLHAPALINHHQKLVEKFVPPNTEVEWKIFLAGPAAIEALLAGAIDLVFVGPSPALNAFVRTEGKAIQVLAGSTFGGGGLVVQKGQPFPPKNFQNLLFASVQVGNTQDIFLRYWLKSHQQNHHLMVRSLHGPDLLMAFQTKFVDGAWVAEPWISRIEEAAKGKLVLLEDAYFPNGGSPSVIAAGNPTFIKNNPKLVQSFLKAHMSSIQFIQKNPLKAQTIASKQIEKDLGKPVPPSILKSSWKRMRFSTRLDLQKMLKLGRMADSLGFLGRHGKHWLAKIALFYNLAPLKQVQKGFGQGGLNQRDLGSDK